MNLIPPEIIERLKRERRERDERHRPAAQIPLPPPDQAADKGRCRNDEPARSSRVIVIDL